MPAAGPAVSGPRTRKLLNSYGDGWGHTVGLCWVEPTTARTVVLALAIARDKLLGTPIRIQPGLLRALYLGEMRENDNCTTTRAGVLSWTALCEVGVYDGL